MNQIIREEYLYKGIQMNYRYFDKKGNELKDGDTVCIGSRIEKLYATDDGALGTDATSKSWIERGLALPCEYGIFPLSSEDMESIEKCFQYAVRDRECGNIISTYDTLEEAKTAMAIYEDEDREDGVYTENFYEVVEI